MLAVRTLSKQGLAGLRLGVLVDKTFFGEGMISLIQHHQPRRPLDHALDILARK